MPLDRRRFLQGSALAAVGGLTGRAARAWTDSGSGRVIHVHHGRAVTWSGSSGLYRDFVDLGAVRQMLDVAVRALKGGSYDEAWQQVFPLSNPESRRLSIKLSLNNALDPDDGAGNDIDAIPEPAIAVIDGFVRAGGSAANVNVYDATNTAPQRHLATWLRARITAHHPAVRFNQAWPGIPSGCGPATCVRWSPAHTSPPPDTRFSDAVLSADYVVNIPIVKRHGQAGVSLGFKNHFGSIDRCDRLHSWVFADTPSASVLADIMASPSSVGDPTVVPLFQKTVLTVGDLLLGQPCRNFDATPRPWTLFGGEWPASLIVSDDVVAADCVMIDLLQAEPATDGGCGPIHSWSRRHLQFAASAGCGVFDSVTLPVGQRFDPARMTYAAIDYHHLDLQSSAARVIVTRPQTGGVLIEWTHPLPGRCEIYRSTHADRSDGLRLGVSPIGRWLDPNPPEPAFYWVRYIGP